MVPEGGFHTCSNTCWTLLAMGRHKWRPAFYYFSSGILSKSEIWKWSDFEGFQFSRTEGKKEQN